jgi:dTDP-4-amino-4,6-dideoxygalactose transaminase
MCLLPSFLAHFPHLYQKGPRLAPPAFRPAIGPYNRLLSKNIYLAINSPTMIPVFKPYIGSDTLKAACEALDLGWLGMGSYVDQFEQKLTEAFELPPESKLVCVNTCTSALHLALHVAGVGPGDEVITPALNNVGDFQAIGMCGAKPVFVDIMEDDLGINPDLIERMITPKTKAIIALHYTGATCRVDHVYEIAAKHGLRVLEDCAHATGTRHKGKPVGSYGDLACFSFDAIKTLTCIDGGAIITPNADEAARLLPLRLMGMTQGNDRLYSNNRSYQYDVPVQGYRYHLANLHAAIGLTQLAKLPEFIKNRRRYCRLYNELLMDVPGVITPKDVWDEASIFHYCLRVLDGKRSDLQEHMREQGADTGIHWMTGNKFSLYADCKGADELPVTDKIGEEILTLPLWSYMEEEVIREVASTIRTFYGLSKVS